MAAKLVYFDGRGRGQIVRLTLAATGITFREDDLTEHAQIAKLRSDGHLLFQQVPLLEIDGLRLVQTNAIVQYLARKGNIYGKNNQEAARIDMYLYGAMDFYEPFMTLGFNPDTNQVLTKITDNVLPRYLPTFEKLLKDNGTGFLVGNAITLADIGLLQPLLSVTEFLGDDTLKAYPNLKAFYIKMRSLEKIKAFLNGPQFKKRNDDNFIATAKRVLQF